MATHVSGDGGGFPDGLPLDSANRLSWELGSRVVSGDDAHHRGTWENAPSTWAVSVYRVTTHTDVLAVRTPVGREKFFGVTSETAANALPALERAGWRRTDNPNS